MESQEIMQLTYVRNMLERELQKKLSPEARAVFKNLINICNTKLIKRCEFSGAVMLLTGKGWLEL